MYVMLICKTTTKVGHYKMRPSQIKSAASSASSSNQQPTSTKSKIQFGKYQRRTSQFKHAASSGQISVSSASSSNQPPTGTFYVNISNPDIYWFKQPIQSRLHLTKDFLNFSGLKVGDTVKLRFESDAPFFHQSWRYCQKWMVYKGCANSLASFSPYAWIDFGCQNSNNLVP
ncbi:hypothetical protein QVD17_28779 [Tagetes erecta]|uniref:Uncharacterized protein n=1 Tax=Tagetes erecta TaxID=13708 RepID=A0AAD8NKR1_TARER|nr:hypothetical protein QVD17_28779 [Tagetes erecta]